MRVISGSCKGMSLKAPKGTNTRPTADKVKEAIFSVLGDLVINANILDGFAGSGGLGIEALSRGAEKAVFIDQDPQAIAVVRANLIATGFVDFAKTICGSINTILPRLDYPQFNIIFLDPPYNKGHIQKIEPELLKFELPLGNTLIVLETSSKDPELFDSDRFKMLKKSVYGDTAVLYYELTL